MPKKEIDYSNTLIYKIYCKNPTIKDLYVGHTTNFIQRKYFHKQCCIMNSHHNYNCKLYKRIRETGGWNNWKMEIIEIIDCCDHYDAKIKEQEYIVLLNATLTNDEPILEKKYEENETCMYTSTVVDGSLNKNPNKKGPKRAEKFNCKICHFICSKKSSWNRHITTHKHKILTAPNAVGLLGKSADFAIYYCKCGKSYKHLSSLSFHKQTCKVDLTLDTNRQQVDNKCEDTSVVKKSDKYEFDNATLTKLFLESVKQNTEFQRQMFDLLKDNVGTIHNINSNNKITNNFNLQIFLNETCKDAMNIDEFIDYVKVKLDDFESFGEIGYPKALGDIIVRNLNELDIHQRPIHCSDLKREVLYIKHDGIWFNDENREFMKKSIMSIAHKNIKQIPLWQEANPDSKNFQSKTFERYTKMFRASLGGQDDDENNTFLKKITSLVAKEVVIDKKKYNNEKLKYEKTT